MMIRWSEHSNESSDVLEAFFFVHRLCSRQCGGIRRGILAGYHFQHASWHHSAQCAWFSAQLPNQFSGAVGCNVDLPTNQPTNQPIFLFVFFLCLSLASGILNQIRSEATEGISETLFSMSYKLETVVFQIELARNIVCNMFTFDWCLRGSWLLLTMMMATIVDHHTCGTWL